MLVLQLLNWIVIAVLAIAGFILLSIALSYAAVGVLWLVLKTVEGMRALKALAHRARI